MLPERTNILIVGAGPAGLTCALSLLHHGCHDVVIVDAVPQGENSSRAISIHAATLEALDVIGCAGEMVQLGTRIKTWSLRDRYSRYLTADLSSLSKYTRFPYILLLPQNVTESILAKRLRSLGVHVIRPCTVVGMKNSESDENNLEVSFENGDAIRARYVIGADGARSTVRQLAGINFADPIKNNDLHTVQMLLSDVLLSPAPQPPIQKDELTGIASPHGFSLFVPLPAVIISNGEINCNDPEIVVYRLGCPIPPSYGEAPQSPKIEYLQDLVDKYGPVEISSDPAVNLNPVQVSKILWSSRFRMNSAIADCFFSRFKGDRGGIVLLIGDAAHIHSPAGGQGMNLGIRDAIGLGEAIASHLGKDPTSKLDGDKVLREYAASRHAQALTIIKMTTRIHALGNVSGASLGNIVKLSLLRLLGRIPIVRRLVAWRLSGLGNR